MKTKDQIALQKLEGESIKISGAEAVIRCLLAENVDLIYGYPGGAIMPVYDELYKYKNEIHHVLTRHEQGATHAAQGYARISGKVGVAMATSGPGATNLITGIADAQIDSTPMVCITGQVASHLLGSDAFQETDIVGISTPVTKWNHQITNAAEIPEVIAKAFYIARSGRPGPVLIDITKDAQFAEFDFQYKKCEGVRSYLPVPKTDKASLDQAAEIINGAKKPMIVWGQGVILAHAEEQLKAMIEKTGIPAAWTILGASAISTSHPLNIGMVGMHGNYAPNVLTNDCDVLIAIGMRFDDRVTGKLDEYAKQAKIIHFEIDPAEVDKNVKTDIAVLGDAKASLEMLLPLLKENSHSDWHQKFKDLYAIEYEKVIKHDLYPTKEGLTMGEVLKEINLQSNGNAAIVTDVGQHQMIACRYAEFNKSRSNITSGGLGTMGFCLPASMGAQLGAPDRTVIAVIGDGALTGGMAFEALNYLGEHNEDVLIILNDNNSAIDKNVGGLSAHANYRDYFKSLGLNYLGETNGQNMMHLVPNLKTAIDEKGARVLRVITQGVKVPFSDSSSQLKGYTKSFIDKLSELARANENIVAVSPAMLSGSGLDVFKNEFPKRCFDVGIAEQHAVTMSAGLAKAGKTPICHLYSTFSQRGMDQIIHDVALQNLHVIFMLDRAGLVGSDGATHHGVFDVAMLSGIPNLQILAPASAAELSVMLEWAIDQNGPIIIRFPRTGGALPALHIPKEIHANRMEQLTIGNGEIAVLNFGFLLGEIQESLKEIAIDSVSLFNVRFAKSLSEIDLKQIAKHKIVWLIEDSQKRGGVGEYLAQQLFELGYQGQYFHSGLPDTFIEHGTMQELYAQHDLTHLAFTKKLKILIR